MPNKRFVNIGNDNKAGNNIASTSMDTTPQLNVGQLNNTILQIDSNKPFATSTPFKSFDLSNKSLINNDNSLEQSCASSILSSLQNKFDASNNINLTNNSILSSSISSTIVLTPKNDKKCIKNNLQYSFFNGMINDIKGRFPQYASDITDGFKFQCLTSVVFMFFASFVPSITFGGLMGKYTNEKIGTIETLIAQCICGIIWGLFSAQPLLIMSATGPVLIFEASLYTFCEHLKIDFLIVRFYTGMWIFIISICIIAVDGSRLLKFVTRFTEDIFATLISVIFIAESLHFIWQTFQENPVEDYQFYAQIHNNCLNKTVLAKFNKFVPKPELGSIENLKLTQPLFDLSFNKNNNISLNSYEIVDSIKQLNSVQTNDTNQNNLNKIKNNSCVNAHPNTALLTSIIMFGTFIFAFMLKKLRESFYLGRHLRRTLGDFGVLISIVVIALLVHFFIPDTYLQRLDMPNHIGFTNRIQRGHGLIVNANIDIHECYILFVAFLAAFLIFILIFVETEITELFLMRKERGCRKGSGMNWDLILVGACAFLCSIFGLPWMCVAAVQSLAHCSSLTVMRKKMAGEKQEVDYVIEQRVTTIGVSLLIGLVAFCGNYLRIPLASLFGVFLYLGVMNLSGVQFTKRLMLFLIPEKYFPTAPYTEKMSIWRMHFYTWIQLCCLFIVYVVKHFKQTALAFPFILMLFIIFRQMVLPKIFTEKELQAVDGETENNGDEWMDKDFFENSRIPI